MKHLLPILTLALIGAAMTASAENYYYEYYKRPTPFKLSEKVENVKLTPQEYLPADTDWTKSWNINAWTPSYQYDTITYTNEEEGVEYQITRNSNWNANLVEGEQNFFRIAVSANSTTPTTLYLTDFVDNIGSSKNVNAIYYAPTEEEIAKGLDQNKRAVVEYGYRVLEKTADGKYVPVDDSLTTKLLSVDENGNPVISDYKIVDGEKVVTSSKNASIIDSLYFEKSNLDENSETVDASYYVDRYKYELGTFTKDTIIELYMKDSTGGEVYSYSAFNEGYDSTNPTPAGAMGGFGDGERIDLQTDEMLNGYYFNQNPKVNPNPKDYTVFDKNDPTAAADKAMPLSALNPTATNRIYFGIIASSLGVYTIDDSHTIGGGAAGHPLPGGLQLALIAGLFGLGFCYVRRRKATVA